MEGILREHIEELFEDTAPSKKAVELKEEMLQNLTEKYGDLIADGKTPEAAYNIAVAGIGDISSLLSALEHEAFDHEIFEEQRRHSAMLTSIAVMMYILCALPLIILQILVPSTATLTIGLIILFVVAAAATGVLVYNNMTKVRYTEEADTMVSEFREWQSHSNDIKNLRRAISSALWALVLIVYFIVSFWTKAWYITWVIFILGALLESLISITFSLKRWGRHE